MAILATIFGALGRFAGKLLTAVLGWASTLLFGRVPRERQIWLVVMTFGSVLWVVLLVGVIVPEAGTFLLGFVPIPEFVDENLVRLGMLVAAIVAPLLVGLASLLVYPPERRPKGRAAAAVVLRGYPLAAALAIVLVFLAGVALARKGRALVRRWGDAHVPIVVREDGYDRLVEDLERALDEAGLAVDRGAAPAVLSAPPRLLARVAGPGVDALVPERLVQLTSRDLEIQLYPSDVAIAGTETAVNRARAAMASRLAASTAYLTTAAESQAVEDRLRHVAERRRMDDAAADELRAIDERLAHLDVPYEEWEVLYRERLQVERDLLTGRPPGAVPAGPGRDASAAPGRLAPAARNLPIEAAAAAGLIALLFADVWLALRERAR